MRKYLKKYKIKLNKKIKFKDFKSIDKMMIKNKQKIMLIVNTLLIRYFKKKLVLTFNKINKIFKKD